MQNKEIRYHLYREAAINLFGHTGYKNHILLQHCVTQSIKMLYPSVEGGYVGYRDATTEE